MPDLPRRPYAQEGTLAHALAEACLRNGERTAMGYANSDAAYILEDARGQIKVEMIEAVDVYLAAVWAEYDRLSRRRAVRRREGRA